MALTVNQKYAVEKLQKNNSTNSIPRSSHTQLAPTIAPKSISMSRQDIKKWKQAVQLAKMSENPKRYLLYNLYEDIFDDLLLKSQVNNRKLKALGESFVLKDDKGNVDKELTQSIEKSIWASDINNEILNTRYYGHSLIELEYHEVEQLKVVLLPRQNVDPVNGRFYPDYSQDKHTKFREMREYGTWLLEFGDKGDLGIFNATVPHVLFKRFAISCWSELGEIHGIPPRVLKTNTRNPAMLKRSEAMMRDIGAAAWFIIDSSEEFEFAKQVETNGDVYKNLKDCCNNEMSMAISGAIIGQDTKNGSRSKDEAAQDMLQLLVHSDLVMIEQQWKSKVIPALIKLGMIPEGYTFHYNKSENLEGLWKMVVEAMPHFDVDPVWAEEKFGIKINGKKQPQQNNTLNISPDFFV